ncbi:MAG: lipopolysaccharide heptosyltransferase I [Candidatus Aminicenantes bacterium]|nr:MAG: lipopolysaccharide heptosyltransferase I [Candidatus Aminicenantes bacterium]
MDHFLIIRLSSLGDVVHTLPAFSALRKKFPDAQISWIVEENGKEILDLVLGLDKIVPLKLKRWKLGSRKFWQEFVNLKKEIRDKDQVAIDFQGLVKSGFIAYISGARRRIGFHRKNLKERQASLFYTEKLEEVSEKDHVISKNLKLLSLLGIEGGDYEFPLQIPEESSTTVQMMMENLGYETQKKLVILNVGAAWETKRWHADRWIQLIEEIKNDDHEIFPVLLWGNEVELGLAKEVGRKSDVPLVPSLSLKEVMALIKRAAVLVSGDTFALQAAGAFSTPIVGLFGPTTPSRNGPFREQDRVVFHELECSHCYKRVCSRLECLDEITPEEVASACLEILKMGKNA